MHAKNYVFPEFNKETKTSKDTTLYDYFRRKYNIALEYWYLPLIETEKVGFFPMEVCTLIPNQRFMYKLGPEQTASMIKFAVTRPKDRLGAVNHGVGMLKWHEDPYLNHYGLKIEPTMTVVSEYLRNAISHFAD